MRGLFVPVSIEPIPSSISSIPFSSKMFQACNPALLQLRLWGELTSEKERQRERVGLWGCSPPRRSLASTRPWRWTLPQRPPTPMLPRLVWVSFCRLSLLHDVSLSNFGREVSRWKAVIISRVILVAKLPVRRSFPSPHDMHSNYLEAHKHISEGCWSMRFTQIITQFILCIEKVLWLQQDNWSRGE